MTLSPADSASSVRQTFPPDDSQILAASVDAVRAAGGLLLGRFPPLPLPATPEQVVAALRANDAASLDVLRGLLGAACPTAGWVEDELADGVLPDGDWWVVDPVEGNINHIHGLRDWAVTATLVRDNVAVLTAVHLPLTGTTYTALGGGGAFQDGRRLQTSSKTDLRAALVGTGQASPRETTTTFSSIGRSVAAMLDAALVVRVSVPATLQLIELAAGRMDVFWQHSAVRSGLLAGALLVAEAGGTVSAIDGQPWTLASADFLAGTPALHASAAAVLAPFATSPRDLQPATAAGGAPGSTS